MSTIQLQPRRARTATIVVVDPRRADYAALLDCDLGLDVQLQFLASGRGALRLAQTNGVDLWVINAALPDMSGFDLCKMLKTYPSEPVIYMVTDDYCAEDERAARLCCASFFGCKPVQARWFEDWPRPP